MFLAKAASRKACDNREHNDVSNEAVDMSKKAIPVPAAEVEIHTGSTYPEAFRQAVAGRSRQHLGDHFGLTRYGVNYVELQPGAWSAQRHWHTHEDEFIYVVKGSICLVTDDGEQLLSPGMAAGFRAGDKNGHHLVNRSDATAAYLEIGDRNASDEVFYPDIDLELRRDSDGDIVFRRRDGSDY